MLIMDDTNVCRNESLLRREPVILIYSVPAIDIKT